ncbi:MAG: hypothetical protein ACKVIN_16370 [Longimicrobiales bacterium]|jgi:hypothetical protein
MKNDWRRGLLAIIAITLTTSGCYRYVPAQAEAIPPGTGVRVLITRAGAEELKTVTAIDNDVPLVDGTVAGIERDALLMSVPVGVRSEGFVTSAIEQVVRVPLGEIVSLQRRELNSLATGLTITGGVALMAGIVAIIVKPLLGEQQDPATPPDELSLSINIFSVMIGR